MYYNVKLVNVFENIIEIKHVDAFEHHLFHMYKDTFMY